MNPKRILIALIVAFVTISATDYLIHEVWLKSTYTQEAGKIWRATEEMKAQMPKIFIGQFLVAIAFTMLWVRIALGGAGIQCAIGLGVFMGLAYSGNVVIQGAVQPLPEGLVTKWIVSGIAQSIVVAVVLFLVHRPTKPAPDVSGK